MTLRTATTSGNWNTVGTWDTGVPTGTDTWQINNGVIVTIAADITNTVTGAGTILSGGKLVIAAQMANTLGNITINSGGWLYASRSVSGLLRCAGVINANAAVGATSGLDYGTDTDSIPVTVGAFIEFVCTSDNQVSRGIVCGLTNAVTFKGATRVMQSTLASIAALHADTIVLADNMALRPWVSSNSEVQNGTADAILVAQEPTLGVGVGAENYHLEIYSVAGYVAGTKTVTLGDAGVGNTDWGRGGVTPNFNTIEKVARPTGTKVYLISNNVGIRGSAYNLRGSKGIDASGGSYTIFAKNVSFWWTYYGIYAGSGHTLTSPTFTGNSSGIYLGSGHTLTSPTFTGNNSGINSGSGHTLTSPTFIGNTYGIYLGSGHTLTSPTFTGNNSGIYSSSGHTLTSPTFTGNNSGINLGSGHTLTSPTFIGNTYGIFSGSGHTLTSPTFTGNTNGIYSGSGYTLTSPTFSGNTNGINSGSGHTLTSPTFSDNTNGIYLGSGYVVINGDLSGDTNSLYAVINADLRNCKFATSEFLNYNSSVGERPSWAFVQSFDHNQVVGTIKTWTIGGICSRIVDPTGGGELNWMQLNPESDAYPCFYQRKYSIDPGEWLFMSAKVSKTVTMAYLPRLQIINPFADPLVLGTNNPLAETVIPADGTNTYYPIAVAYQNTSTRRMYVLARMLCKNATGTVNARIIRSIPTRVRV